MDQEQLLRDAEAFARAELSDDSSGHDWWHIDRVTRLARRIAREEGADVFLCALAALLHDIADYKIAGDEAAGQRRGRGGRVGGGGSAEAVVEEVEEIAALSSGGGNRAPMRTLEGRVVQDADRLDALGAIGIARAFAFGGSRGRAMYTPDESPRAYASQAEYHASTASTIAHFHEKLLLLQDHLKTPFPRKLAEERHRYMEAFLRDFAREWDGER